MDEYRNPVDEHIEKIDAYLEATGMPESRLGLLACANQRVVERIRKGNARVESLRAVLDYIHQHPAKLS